MNGVQGLLARILDAALVVAGAVAASQVRFEDLAGANVDAAFIAFAAAFALVVFPAFGIYESWRGRSIARFAGQISIAWVVVQGCGLTLMFLVHKTDLISRLWFAYWTGMTGGALVVSRGIVHFVLGRIRHAGLNLRKVAIVGTSAQAGKVLRKINASTASGFRAAAIWVTDGKDKTANVVMSAIPVFCDFEAFANHIRREDVQELWLALALSEEGTVSRIVDAFRDDLVNIRYVPDVSNVALFDSGMTDLLGEPAINLVASPMPGHAMWKKDVFDRVFAALAIFALTPLLVVISIAVKLSSRGPVLFTQKRKGADGRVFKIYKFRTMRIHKETPGVVKQATRNDARITRVGAFLRRTSLDELPQFFNVLRGEMSVVGPRPHAIEHDELYRKVVNGYIHRYRVKPGITGWAQVNGFRGQTDRIEKMQGRVECDLYYVRNWSFSLDMRIVLATIVKGFRHRNAY
jgi:Undecaprenyl-phosphate glucose phosphotransferase